MKITVFESSKGCGTGVIDKSFGFADDPIAQNGATAFKYGFQKDFPEDVLEEVSKEMADKVEVCKMNVDESPNTAAQYGIRSIPTMFLFKDGKQIDVKVGLNSKATLESWINSNL